MWQIRFKVTVVETTDHPSFCVGYLCIYQCLYLSVCLPLMQLRLFDVKGFEKEQFDVHESVHRDTTIKIANKMHYID